MQSVVLILTLAVVFIFGFFVARSFGHFLDENRMPEDEERTDVNGSETGAEDTGTRYE